MRTSLPTSVLTAAVLLSLSSCAKRQITNPTEKYRGTPVRVSQFGEFATWDANGDGDLTRKEFASRLHEDQMYNDFDGDGDGELTDIEFTTSLYKAWDLNGDEVVDVYEYRWGNGAWFADNTMFGVFEDWDDDGDQELTLIKHANTPAGNQWDADGNGEITDLEFRRGLWNAWDLDGDEVVDIYEYRGQQGS